MYFIFFQYELMIQDEIHAMAIQVWILSQNIVNIQIQPILLIHDRYEKLVTTVKSSNQTQSLKAFLKYVDINYYFEIYIPLRDS